MINFIPGVFCLNCDFFDFYDYYEEEYFLQKIKLII